MAKKNNQNQQPEEALSKEEMDALAQAVIPKMAAGEKSDDIIAHPEQPNLTAAIDTSDQKVQANPEPVRLPTMKDIQNIDREQLVHTGSETLYENIKVGEPDYNYKKPEGSPDGLIIENKPTTQKMEPKPGLSIATQESLDKYLSNMEEDMRDGTELRATLQDINPNLQPTPEQYSRLQEKDGESVVATPQTETPLHSENGEMSDRARRHAEAIVIIDKIESKNLQFTAEERKKLETAEVIRLNEVRTVDIKTIRRKRERRTDVHNALQRNGNTMTSTNILLPASGYYAEMLGCAPYEIMTLQSDDDPLTDNQIKWSLIYEKMKWSSVKFNSFEDFMKATAVADYETFVWGILRSTFEDKDKISINCTNPKCVDKAGNPTQYEIDYSVVGLLRAEELNERLKQSIARVANARTVEEATEAHNLAPVNDILSIELPSSKYIVEIAIGTVDEFLNSTLDHLASDDLEPQQRQAALLATAVREIGIPDYTGAQVEYDFYDDPSDLTEIIFRLNSKDLVILANKVSEHTGDVSFKYGFIDLQCPKCRQKTEYQPMDVASILFYRNALSMNVNVE